MTGCGETAAPPKPVPPPVAQPVVCNVGEMVDGKHRDFTCAEITAQGANCPVCTGG